MTRRYGEPPSLNAVLAAVGLSVCIVSTAHAQPPQSRNRDSVIYVNGSLGVVASTLHFSPVHPPGVYPDYVKPPPALDGTAALDIRVSKHWSVRGAFGHTAFKIGERADFDAAGHAIVVPPDRFVERRVVIGLVYRAASRSNPRNGAYGLVSAGQYWHHSPVMETAHWETAASKWRLGSNED